MKEVFDGKTYYDILELPISASFNDIQRAYEKTKEAYSPSSPALYTIFTPEEAQQLNILIDSAFSVLINPLRRAEYDRSIRKEYDMKTSTQPGSDARQSDVTHNDPNLGKTVFGHYTLDAQFEETLKSSEDFDGNLIQKVRHYRNINIEQLSERSKISKTYLLAIEAHDFDSLPAKVFVRGFIVQISKLLNLDSNKVSNSYMKLFDNLPK